MTDSLPHLAHVQMMAGAKLGRSKMEGVGVA